MNIIEPEEIKAIGKALGFDRVGIARLCPKEKEDAFLEAWVKAGYHGGMDYLADLRKRRDELFCRIPGARSVIVLAANYFKSAEADGSATLFPKGRVARYARGRDYHRVIREKLRAFEGLLKKEYPSAHCLSCVDTEPLFERAHAEDAGFGFRGKNTNLLSEDFGPWLFLAEIITDLDLEADVPEKHGSCGNCRKCLEACPAGAIVEPYKIDARRCIAYLTVEHKGVIPRALRPSIKDRVFGCDACLGVCPFSRFSKETAWSEFEAETGTGKFLDIAALFKPMSNREYAGKFRDTALLRASRKMMLRNAAVVLGNLKDERGIPILKRALEKEVPLVRIHAAWALGRIGGSDARGILVSRLECEEDPEVKEEIKLSLKEMER